MPGNHGGFRSVQPQRARQGIVERGTPQVMDQSAIYIQRLIVKTATLDQRLAALASIFVKDGAFQLPVHACPVTQNVPVISQSRFI